MNESIRPTRFHNESIRPTRFHELGYQNQAPNLWRIIDLSDNLGTAIGPQYVTKTELLVDLERFATDYGADGAGIKHSVISRLDVETAIESYMDVTSAETVFAIVSDICISKAAHLRSDWQDNKTARRWEQLARFIDKAYSKASELSL